MHGGVKPPVTKARSCWCGTDLGTQRETKRAEGGKEVQSSLMGAAGAPAHPCV